MSFIHSTDWEYFMEATLTARHRVMDAASDAGLLVRMLQEDTTFNMQLSPYWLIMTSNGHYCTCYKLITALSLPVNAERCGWTLCQLHIDLLYHIVLFALYIYRPTIIFTQDKSDQLVYYWLFSHKINLVKLVYYSWNSSNTEMWPSPVLQLRKINPSFLSSSLQDTTNRRICAATQRLKEKVTIVMQE